MTIFAFPERLRPGNIIDLLNAGVVDAGAILVYAALILVAILFVKRLRLKSLRNTLALVIVIAIIGLTVAFSNWPDRVPPYYIHLHGQQTTLKEMP